MIHKRELCRAVFLWMHDAYIDDEKSVMWNGKRRASCSFDHFNSESIQGHLLPDLVLFTLTQRHFNICIRSQKNLFNSIYNLFTDLFVVANLIFSFGIVSFWQPEYYKDAPHFRRIGDGPEYRLEIPRAKLDYTGTYTAIASNCHGETRAIISLQIYAKGNHFRMTWIHHVIMSKKLFFHLQTWTTQWTDRRM